MVEEIPQLRFLVSRQFCIELSKPSQHSLLLYRGAEDLQTFAEIPVITPLSSMVLRMLQYRGGEKLTEGGTPVMLINTAFPVNG